MNTDVFMFIYILISFNKVCSFQYTNAVFCLLNLFLSIFLCLMLWLVGLFL